MQREPELIIGAKPFGALWGPSPLSGCHAKGFPYAPTTVRLSTGGRTVRGAFSIRRRWVMTKRETPLLVDELAKLLREVRQLARRERWKAPPPWWRQIDAALARYQKEVSDGS